jgi:predicted DNA-binding protein YlxM (UPF0122 family)
MREYDISPRSSGPKRRDDINKEKLEKLYLVEELSTRNIAEKLDTGRSTVYSRLKRFNIHTRDIQNNISSMIVKTSQENQRKRIIYLNSV